MKAYELLYFVDPTCNEETRAGVMKRRATTPSSTSTQIPP